MVKSKVFVCGLILLICCGLVCAEPGDEHVEQEFGGIGLQVVPTSEGELVVLSVLPGSPAAKQNLAPGDLVFQVDDFRLKGSEFGKVVTQYLWGPVNSKLTLHYRRPGLSGDHSIQLRRVKLNRQLTVTPTVQDSGGLR
jgi:C-terminal processing protease CtpA/Prc